MLELSSSILPDQIFKHEFERTDSFLCRSHGVNYTDFLRRIASPVYPGMLLYCAFITGHRILPGHRMLVENCDFLSLRLILAGNEYLRYEGNLYLAEPGDLMILPPGNSFEYATGPAGFCDMRGLALRGNILGAVLTQTGLNDKVFLRPACGGAEFLAIFEDYKRLFETSEPQDPAVNAGIALRLLQHLALEQPEHNIPQLLLKMVHYIENNLEQDLSIPQLSRKFGISRVSINRLFKDFFHVTPFGYVTGCRMRNARIMLTMEGLSVKECAVRLGFSTPFSFSVRFKQHFGYSPKCCRTRNQSDANTKSE